MGTHFDKCEFVILMSDLTKVIPGFYNTLRFDVPFIRTLQAFVKPRQLNSLIKQFVPCK
jgi:hypothetical protein